MLLIWLSVLPLAFAISTITIWYSRIQKTNLWIMKENFLKFKATLSLAWQTLLKAVIQKQENTLIEQAVMSESSQKKRGLKVSMLIKLPIIVSDQILKQPRRLTNEEFEIMKHHARDGGAVVKRILDGITDEEYIHFAADIATYHHERWDGTGYPLGLKEEAIPLSARIMAIADVYDALISKRCYKDAVSPEEAFEIIKSESGTHFDPKLVEVFLEHKDRFIPKSEAPKVEK